MEGTLANKGLSFITEVWTECQFSAELLSSIADAWLSGKITKCIKNKTVHNFIKWSKKAFLYNEKELKTSTVSTRELLGVWEYI